MTQTSTRDYIIIATIAAIEKFGLAHVTTRRIADEAGVNNAALHYYFGTKENLVEHALALSLQRIGEDTAAILSVQEEYPERLKTLFEYFCDGVLRFPNLMRAHLSDPLMEGTPNSPFPTMLADLLMRSSAEFETRVSDSVHQRLRMAFQAAMAALLFAGLLPPKSGVSAAVDLHNETTRTAFIEVLVDMVMQQVNEQSATQMQ